MDIIHIGLGRRRQHWLDIVRKHPEARSVACVDSEPLTLEWVKAHFPSLGAMCYTSLSEALQHVTADAVIIASSPALHTQHAIEALEVGLGVLLESPLATSLTEGARIFEAARRTKRPVMIAQNYCFARYEYILQQLVQAEQVGTITHVSCIDKQMCLSTDPLLAQGDYSQVLNVAVQHFDSLRSILGVQPMSVMARCSKAPWSAFQHGSTTEALLEMTHNIHIQYYGSLTSTRSEHALWIEGDKGVLWTDRRWMWWRKRGWRFFLPLRLHKILPRDAGQYPCEGTMSLFNQLREAVVAGNRLETSGEDNLWTLAMVEAAICSDKSAKAIRIADLFAATGISVRYVY
jgi:predicted dehydrogenase